MIVYQSTKNGFLQDVMSNDIERIIHKAFFDHLGRRTSPNEVNSWRNLMSHMHPDRLGYSQAGYQRN